MQSTGEVRRCEQMGREVREGMVEEEGHSPRVLIERSKAAGLLSEATIPKGGGTKPEGDFPSPRLQVKLEIH